jgi:hypothetical protein
MPNDAHPYYEEYLNEKGGKDILMWTLYLRGVLRCESEL